MNAQVLVVDDELDVRESTVAMFESEGYPAVGASNGRVALDLLRDGVRPCIIILDLMMPVMDGWSFRAAQLCHIDFGRIPIIVVSARGRDDVDAAAESLRAVAGMEKPLDCHELLRVVEQHCGPPTLH
jgi:CheY-like chemotaxis protein